MRATEHAPLHDLEAERALLGAVLLEPDATDRVRELVEPGDLTPRHALILRAMCRLHDRGAGIDPATLASELGAELGDAGGPAYIAGTVDGLPAAPLVPEYARAVRICTRRRRQARLAQDLRDAALIGRDTAELLAALNDSEAAAAEVPVRTLAELLADPSMTRPPAVVAARMAWRSRTTLLAAPEKGGKSTAAGAVAAAITRSAPWLDGARDDGPADPADVLWIALDEHVGELARRLQGWRADPGRVYVLDDMRAAGDPLAAVAAAASRVRPALIVVDHLAAVTERWAPDSGSAAAWTPLLRRLVHVARDTDAALLLLHHARHADGRYRDSSAIGAAVDVLIEMGEGAEPTQRRLRIRARWPVEDYTVRLGSAGYELVSSGEQSLEARILAHVAAHPGCTLRELREAIVGRAGEIGAAVTQLVGAVAIVDRGGPRGSRSLYPATGSRTGSQPSEDDRFPQLVSTGSGTVPAEGTTEPRRNGEGGSPGGFPPKGGPPGTAPTARPDPRVPASVARERDL